jgi:hypothetical protein
MSIAGQRQCTECQKGTYASAPSASACATCAQGQFTDKTGAKTCTACGVHQFTDKISPCTYCPAGKWFDSYSSETVADCLKCSRAPACPIGTFQGAGAAPCTCTSCAAGKYGDAENLVGECKKCGTGRFQSKTAQWSCDHCDAGSANGETAATDVSACTACEFGRFAALGSAMCSVCPDKIVACPVGKFRNTHDIGCACTSCSAGKFTDSNTATSCSKCVAGRYSQHAGQRACSTCVRGKFAAEAGAVYCASCNAGTYAANVASTTCTMCEAGQYQGKKGQAQCSACKCGEYSAVGSKMCKECDGSGSSFATCTMQCIAAGRVNFQTAADALVNAFQTYIAPSLTGYSAPMVLGQVDKCKSILTEGSIKADVINKDADEQKKAAAATLQALAAANVQELARAKAETERVTTLQNEAALKAILDANTATTVQLRARLAKERTDAVQAERSEAQAKAAAALAVATLAAAAAKAASLASVEASLAARTGIPDGQVPLDIDGNGVVNVQDAVTLFVAQTMAEFGAGAMITQYRALHPQNHAPATRTVADVLKTVHTAIHPVHKDIVALAFAAEPAAEPAAAAVSGAPVEVAVAAAAAV